MSNLGVKGHLFVYENIMKSVLLAHTCPMFFCLWVFVQIIIFFSYRGGGGDE